MSAAGFSETLVGLQFYGVQQGSTLHIDSCESHKAHKANDIYNMNK
jgi:hypothetical protein